MYNEKTKNAIYKWRETHKEKHAQYHNEQQKLYNERHKETILAKKRLIYNYRIFINNKSYIKEAELYRNILLD